MTQAIIVQFPSQVSEFFTEFPAGFFLFPGSLVEDPLSSGLYLPPGYLIESLGLYSIPDTYIGTDTSNSGTNIKSFSVQEDATPIDPGSSFGGVGQITLTMNETKNSKYLLGEVVLGAGTRGKTSGLVSSVTSTNGDITITADSILNLFNSDRITMPLNTTLSAAFQYYCTLVGITNDLVIDTSIASRAIIYPGWNGNMWIHIKQILSKEQIEMSLVFNRIYVRPLRLLVANTDRTTSFGWSTDNKSIAQQIEIYYYNNTYGTQKEIYPLTTESPSIYQVDASETVTFTQQLNASLVSVNQPMCIDFVYNHAYDSTGGVYAVSGNDGLPITAAQWIAQGGSITIRITDDPSIIEVTIHGASMTDYAPYRIAMTSGSNNFYNSLHITGTGIIWDKKLLTLTTGAADTLTSEKIGTTVDNPFVSTLAEAYNLGAITAGIYSGSNTVISGSAYDINRSDTYRELIQATIGDFNAEVTSGTLISVFNVTWNTKTIADFNDYWANKVNLLWENQIFGNASGARILTSDAIYRISTATTTEADINFSGIIDTLINDFNPLWTGKTITDFNAEFITRTMKDFSITPLRIT